jgi:hypothetical protein
MKRSGSIATSWLGVTRINFFNFLVYIYIYILINSDTVRHFIDANVAH